MHIRPLRPADAEQAFQLRVQAFSSLTHATYDPDEIYIPDEHRLVAVDRDRVIGHAGVWPVAQTIGGRAVPMGGIGALTVAHDQRGAGVGSRLIAAVLDHAASAGLPISSLYPSTPVPYRRWGWEFAGEHIRRQLPTRALLDVPPPTAPVALRPYEPADLPALVALFDARASRESGGFVGGRRWLARALQIDPDEPELQLVATRDDRAVGLAIIAKRDAEDSTYALDIVHLCGVDRDAERALLRSIAHHHPVGATTTLRSAPADPLLFELGTLMRPARGSQQFMTRLVDVPAAFAARGWPRLRAAVSLEIVDTRRPANGGRHVLEVRDGEAAMSPGGAGEVAIDVGALAALYTGFATAGGLAAAGRLTADAGVLATLDAVFGAPMPFMRVTY